MSSNAAGQNAQAAQNIANQDLAYTAPYGMNTGIGNTSFSSTGNGNQAYSSLSAPYQGLEQGMLGSAGGFLGSLDQMGANGGFSPFLQNAYSQYQNSLPGAGGAGFNSLYGQAFGNNLGTANAFGGAANGLLGALGNFNPTQAGANYTNLLAQQTAPANALAAQNLTQSLFNSGGLGSTGGANALQALGNMQSQQYVGQQVAGQQLGLQQQGLLGSLAGQYGGLSNSMNSTNFGMGANLNDLLYGRQLGQAQQGFQNALGLNQSALQNMGAYSGLASGLLGGGMNIDNALLNQMQVAANMGAQRTGAATTAGGINLAGQLAQNNTNAAIGNGLINGLAGANWAGLFGGGGNGNTPYNNAIAAAGMMS